VVLRSNPGETVFTPFMGVGSEVWVAVVNDRRGVGVELKSSYYRQAVKNMEQCKKRRAGNQSSLFDDTPS
jgi:DNA modification methylase